MGEKKARFRCLGEICLKLFLGEDVALTTWSNEDDVVTLQVMF